MIQILLQTHARAHKSDTNDYNDTKLKSDQQL